MTVSPVVLSVGLLVVALGGLGVAAAVRRNNGTTDPDGGTDPDDGPSANALTVEERETGVEAALEPPDLAGAKWGKIGEALVAHRHHSEQRKLAKEGYVKWLVVDGTLRDPKYVKPEADGEGVPKVYEGGQPYLFPKEAAVAESRTGMWTFIHKKGDAKPLNLRDPPHEPIPGDKLHELLTMSVEASPPSLLDKFDLDSQDLIYVGIGAILLVAAAQQFLGGA